MQKQVNSEKYVGGSVALRKSIKLDAVWIALHTLLDNFSWKITFFVGFEVESQVHSKWTW